MTTANNNLPRDKPMKSAPPRARTTLAWPRRLMLASLVSLTLITPALQAQNLPLAKPDEVGLSAQRLSRIEELLPHRWTPGAN